MPPSLTIEDAYGRCEELTRAEAKSFAEAIRLLPQDRRRYICAVYAFCRVADDLVDQPGSLERKKQDWARFQESWERLSGISGGMPVKPEELVVAAFVDTLRDHSIPRRYAEELLGGIGRDLIQDRYATFDDLRAYCYGVASTVGLFCLYVLGSPSEAAEAQAVEFGVGMQIVNILRDVAEDAVRGRVYLPMEDLIEFKIDVEDILAGKRPEHFESLIRLQRRRALDCFGKSAGLAEAFRPECRRFLQGLRHAYGLVLDRVAPDVPAPPS